MVEGISRNMFIAGLVIAILASSAVSTVISTQLAVGPQGPKGDQGDKGEKGDNGDIGPQGLDGTNGVDGKDGTNGTDGADGLDGKSAYQIWLDQGTVGTEQDFLDSLKGEQGPAGVFTIENMSGWLPAPAYDSGWIGPLRGGTSHELMIHHGLKTTNVLVYLTANMDSGWLLIHQRWFGGDDGRGMWWFNSTENSLTVWVLNSLEPEFEYIRVQIWRIAEP